MSQFCFREQMEEIKEEPNEVQDSLRDMHIKYCMFMSQLGGTSSKRFYKLHAQLSEKSSDCIEHYYSIYKNIEKVLFNISHLTRDFLNDLEKCPTNFKIPQQHADILNILVQINNCEQIKEIFPSSTVTGTQTEETTRC